MADLYKVVYETSGPQPEKVVFVTATSVANALAAVQTNDSKHKVTTTQPSVTVLHHNVISGS